MIDLAGTSTVKVLDEQVGFKDSGRFPISSQLIHSDRFT